LTSVNHPTNLLLLYGSSTQNPHNHYKTSLWGLKRRLNPSNVVANIAKARSTEFSSFSTDAASPGKRSYLGLKGIQNLAGKKVSRNIDAARLFLATDREITTRQKNAPIRTALYDRGVQIATLIGGAAVSVKSFGLPVPVAVAATVKPVLQQTPLP
jgi:hypothetical protein